METLSPHLRRQLERTVVQARDVAEVGARVALEALAVHHHEPYRHMTSEQRRLRRRLRAHARQLGDRLDARSGSQGIDHLVHECAYEHWHGMLFARFLAENHLLTEPEMSIAITLDECEELAKDESLDKWALASRFAHRMLPQVFRPDHPVFEVQFAREHRLKLEGLVESLPHDVFTATDSLGWVYQFWQSKKKEEVNRSEVKIGADELPAVTQLFTEPYMVQFLLHNSLGAWWVSRYPDRPCPADLTYLRYAPSPLEGEGGGEGHNKAPAGGSFGGWPDDLSQFRLLDPCCGSGHFLVAAFMMLVPMRMALENLSAAETVDAVLRDNLHGLELDQRCVAVAAFALALEAWRYPNSPSPSGRGAGGEGSIGYRPLPRLNLAWCGQPIAGKREQWLSLAGSDSRLKAGMAALYYTFRDAPVLGSLIDPSRSVSEDVLTAGFAELGPLLERALRKHAGDEEWEETAIAARGLADAARLLGSHYHLVVTNVPYLARGKQSERLRKFAEGHYPKSKNDLANVFLERCLELSLPESAGVTQIVMPQNWLFLASYKGQRKHLLEEVRWNLLARLGPGAFDSVSGEVVNVILLTLTRTCPSAEDQLHGIDASAPRTAAAKAAVLRTGNVVAVNQQGQLRNPDAIISLDAEKRISLMSQFAYCYQGTSTGDNLRFVKTFWETVSPSGRFEHFQNPAEQTSLRDGRQHIVDWSGVCAFEGAAIRGEQAWNKKGVAIGQMRSLPATLYDGSRFSNSTPVIVPLDSSDLAALWCYCGSSDFATALRSINQKLSVDNGYVSKMPIDMDFWRDEAKMRFPQGLPKPASNDSTQWIFHGHPRPAESPLQVAVARLLGYHWPPESDPDMELADEARAWIEKTKALHAFEDEDGIVCLPSIRGEPAGHERLLHLLEAAWGHEWSNETVAKLLAGTGASSLDEWLRNQFFEQHCKLFHHRPFIWHIWDGRRRDGFHALVNYHKLAEGNSKGRRLLESLTYSYLGDWIARQQDGVKRGEGGAEDRVAAALALQKRLIAIIEGEPPFDIFVRWKPIEEQPIGWEPDINDGVRLNIRPFMAQDIPGGKRGAGILRAKPNIHWKKDRGKEPVRDQAQFPWFWNNGTFTGERVNDVHLTNAEKRAAREERAACDMNAAVSSSGGIAIESPGSESQHSGKVN